MNIRTFIVPTGCYEKIIHIIIYHIIIQRLDSKIDRQVYLSKLFFVEKCIRVQENLLILKFLASSYVDVLLTHRELRQ